MHAKYVDYRTDPFSSLSADEFEVSSREYSLAAVIAAVVGAILCISGALLMTFYQQHSAIFLTGLSINVIGSSAFGLGAIYGIFYHFFVRSAEQLQKHQQRIFHEAKSKKEYLEILEKDQGATYSFQLPKLRQELESYKTTELRRKSTEEDIVRGMRCHFNGVPIPIHEVEEKYGPLLYSFVNQSTMFNMMCILRSRYHNDYLTAHLVQVSDSMKFDLIEEDGEQYFIFQLGSQFRIYDENLEKYIRIITKMNVRTGDAVMTWNSPQNDLPQF